MNFFLRLWTGYSDNKRNIQVRSLIENYAGVPRENYKMVRTKVSNVANDDVFSIQFGEGNKMPLIIIHGYGGSGCMFYKYLQTLLQHHDVYLLDLRGTGMSGRSSIKCNSLEQYESYFIEGIDTFVREQKLSKFVLIAHSMGAYFSSLYANKYPEKIERLVLLSPAGFSKIDDKRIKEINSFINRMKCHLRFVYKKAIKMINSGNSPFSLFRKFGLITFLLLKRYQKYIRIPNKKESSDYIKMLYYINVQKPCSDCCLNKVITYQGFGRNALEDRVKLPENTIIMYGQHDWIDCTGAVRYAGAHPSASFDVIKDAGHNLNIQGVDEILSILHKKGV